MKKKSIFKIVLVVILLLVCLFVLYKFITNKINESNVKKMNSVIKEVNKDKTSYVFVEINPSLVLTVKNNTVENIACLNDDCMSIYGSLDVKGKELSKSIDIIYLAVESNGFDTTNGITVSSTDTINIENKEYIKVEYIDSTKEKELLSEIKNNEEIKNIDNSNYYSNLLNELKKDKDYDKVYTCSMNNNELECHIILDTGINDDSDYNNFDFIKNIFPGSQKDIMNTLKKFNYNIENYKVIINDLNFAFVPLFTHNDTKYKNVLVTEIIDKVDDELCSKGFIEYMDGKCEVRDGTYIIPLNEINLVKPNALFDNIIEIRIGIIEHALKMYYMSQGLEY